MSTGAPTSSNSVQRHLPRILFGAVLLPILFFAGWFVYWRWSNASAIRRLEVTARINGEPLTYVELAAMYPRIPDNQNGAVLLMKAWEKDDPLFWKPFQDRAKDLPTRKLTDVDPTVPYLGSKLLIVGRTNDIDGAGLGAADAYLKKETEHLEEIRAALRYSEFWFPIRMSDQPIWLPHLSLVYREARNFSLEALLATESGDLDSAVAAIEEAAHTGKFLKSEPFMGSQLTRLACRRIALNDMERLLSRRSLSETQLERLGKLLEELGANDGLRLGIIEQRVWSLHFLNEWETAEHGSLSRILGKPQADKRCVLVACDRLLSLGKVDTPKVIQEFETICTNATNASKVMIADPISWSLFPSLQRALYNFAGFEARRRAAIIALAVERYRMQHDGKLPQQLSEITPQYLKEIPADPFDGKPLRFKRLQRGFVVYSVGVNRVDDGGDEREHRDETFFIER